MWINEVKIVMDENIILFSRITEHLKLKEDRQDDLNGIILSIYEKEIKNVSDKVVVTLSQMIKNGIIVELKDQNGKSYYHLVKDKNNTIHFNA